MKMASVAEVKAKLGDYLARGDEGPVVVTRDGKPVGVLLAISDEEEIERLMLAYSPKFQAVLAVAKEQIRRGEKISSEDLRRELQEMDTERNRPQSEGSHGKADGPL